MRASVWVALRSMLVGVLIVCLSVPIAIAGRRHRCAPRHCSPCYSAPVCYSAPTCSPPSCSTGCETVVSGCSTGDCSTGGYVVSGHYHGGGCADGSCVVGGGHSYYPPADCPNCVFPTHPDPSIIDGNPPIHYGPAGGGAGPGPGPAPGPEPAPAPAPAPAPGGAGGGAGGPNDPPPPAVENLRPAPAPMPAPMPAPEAPPAAPEAIPPKAPDDPFGAAAPKPAPAAEERPVVAPAVIENAPPVVEEAPPAPVAPPAAPPAAAPADDDPFKISKEGHLPVRVWTDDSGEHRVFASLMEIHEGKVRLLKESGRTTTVPFARLSDEDREYVREAQTKFGFGQVGQVAGR